MRKITRKLFLFGIMSISSITYSQTTTINYLNSGLSTSACNIFNPATSVNGILHSSHAGGATYTTANGVSLSTTPKASQPGGTAYVINYNFIPGNKYDISITAAGNSAMVLKTSVVPNFNQFNTNGTSSCTPDNYAYSYSLAGYGQFSTPTSTSSVTYSIPQFSIPGSTNYQYLIIWATGGRLSLDLDALSISKIVITKTATNTFILGPTPVSVVCGSTTPQAFTITNVNPPSNITDYTWNLGSTNNGWLLNGLQAPQTISTGTIGTLTLTPSCSDVKNNISATVTAGGITYQTNTSSIINTLPTLSMSGDLSFCTGTETYTVSGVHCNATVTWISSNTNIATISPNGNPATLTKTGNGIVTITATVNGVTCLTNNTISKTIAVGAPQSSNIILWSSTNSTTIGNPVGFVAGYPPDNRCQIQATQWQVTMDASLSAGNFPCESDNETSKNIFFQSTGTAYVQASIQNGCGWSDWSAGVPITVNSGYYFIISPNPASGQITVTQKDKTTAEIAEIKIFDNTGNLKQQAKYTRGTRQAQLNTFGLKSGIYFIQISGGQYKERQQLVIQK